jgi:hypothetical protein
MYLKCRDCEDEAVIVANKVWVVYRQDENNPGVHIKDELEFNAGNLGEENNLAFCQHCFNENNWYGY